MDNITVIKVKALAKQSGIKGYYKLRKAELNSKIEAHPDVNAQVLIPGLEIPRNTTRSVNTSAILDDPILDDNTPVLQPTPKFNARSMQKIKDFGNWLLNHIPANPKVVDEALESFKNLIKKTERVKKKSALTKFAIQYRIDGKDNMIVNAMIG